MKLKIDKQEIDVDLHGVANFLFAAGAAMRGEDVPDFVDQQKQVDAISLACVAVMLQTYEAEALMRTLIKDVADFVGECGGINAASAALGLVIKNFESWGGRNG